MDDCPDSCLCGHDTLPFAKRFACINKQDKDCFQVGTAVLDDCVSAFHNLVLLHNIKGANYVQYFYTSR